MPRHCLTQGIGTILEARHLLLVADGERKAEAVHQLVEGPVSARWPATALQLHPHVTVLLDPAAAAGFRLARLLPGDLRGQAGLAGPLSVASHSERGGRGHHADQREASRTRSWSTRRDQRGVVPDASRPCVRAAPTAVTSSAAASAAPVTQRATECGSSTTAPRQTTTTTAYTTPTSGVMLREWSGVRPRPVCGSTRARAG